MSWSAALLLVRRLDVVSIVAGTGRWKLEGLDGEWEVLIIRIVDQEPVVDVLLKTLGLVAGWDQWAGLPSSGALLDTGGLGESLVVSLHTVDNNPPLAVSVDGSLRLDVGSDGGTEVSLLDDLLQSLDAVLGIGQHVLVDGLDTLVVVLESMLDLIGRIFSILQTPSLGVTNGALGRFVVFGLVVGFWLMVRSSVMDRLMVRCWLMVRSNVVDWLMVRCWLMVRGRLMVWSSVVDRDLVVDRSHGSGVSNNGSGIASYLRCVDWGGVIHWLMGTIGRGGGGVAINSCVRDGTSSFSLSVDCDSCSCQDKEL